MKSSATVYDFSLTGTFPVLFHSDIPEKADLYEAWLKSPEARTTPKGDDRHPGWKWQTYVPDDGSLAAFPNTDVMAAIKNGAKKVVLRGNESYLRAATTGIYVSTEYCRWEGPKGPMTVDFMKKIAPSPFAEQAAAVKKIGGTLDVKRLPINNGKSKNIRVRAKFDQWTVVGQMMVIHDIVPEDKLKEIMELAGRLGGLGDYRPSSRKPGLFGQFDAKYKLAK